MLKEPDVVAYLADLAAERKAKRAEQEALQAQANSEAAQAFVAKTKISRELILERMQRIAEIADGTLTLKVSAVGENGETVEAEKSCVDLSQARQTWMALGGELFGMFPQRSKVDANVTTPAPAEPVTGNTLEAAKSYLAGWGSRHAATKPPPIPQPDAVPTPTVAGSETVQ